MSDRSASGRGGRRWGRWLITASGLLYLVFFLVAGVALAGQQPMATDSAESIRAYVAAHLIGIHLHHTFLGLATISALWFIVVISRTLRQAEGDPGIYSTLALAGGGVFVALDLADKAVHSATFVNSTNSTQLQGLLTAVDRELVILELFAWFTFFGATAALALGSRVLPAWLSWSAAVLAVLDLAIGAYAGLTGVNASTTDDPFVPVLLLSYLPALWFAATSVVLMRRLWAGR